MYIDSWEFVVWDFKKINWRYCIAELTFIFGECNKASDNIWTFPRVPVPDTYIWKKTTTWFTCAPVIPCCLCTETWNGTETVLVLRYGDCRLLPNANCGEKNLSRGQNGRVGRVSGNKTFFFFFFFFGLDNDFHFLACPFLCVLIR